MSLRPPGPRYLYRPGRPAPAAGSQCAPAGRPDGLPPPAPSRPGRPIRGRRFLCAIQIPNRVGAAAAWNVLMRPRRRQPGPLQPAGAGLPCPRPPQVPPVHLGQGLPARAPPAAAATATAVPTQRGTPGCCWHRPGSPCYLHAPRLSGPTCPAGSPGARAVSSRGANSNSSNKG